ncbi:hypothetical protein MCOR19_006355 [Pyricularia oryzae]|nr:hypothetical protein MCOR19_006355 [Pyricularia oryzae]KAI6487271.1 hypothetical protein MCOR18_003172 [Pyricularia oryzae]
MKFIGRLALLLTSTMAAIAAAQSPANQTYTNPVIPGWHSDPSCIRTPDGIFLCVASTFVAFPGLPIYASRNLVDWKLVSHVWSRESQLPGISWSTFNQMGGMYAATIRMHEGTYYVACEYLNAESVNEVLLGVLFKTTDPFSDEAWSDPVLFYPNRIDPDLFWDDDGKVYAATQGIVLQELNIETGELSQPAIELWNGTGGVWPEGPHFYKRDGWYYLLIAEGGTATDHAVTMARARNITGPYEPSPHNPHLTNRGTNELFQTVGHADLFQDGDGNWWGMCLATRSGPEYSHYPMGRETVLFPVTWEEGEWPVMQPVRGTMEGPLPVAENALDLPGYGPFVTAPQAVDFKAAGAAIPPNWMYWRVPRDDTFSVSQDRGLKIVPTRSNLTGEGHQDHETNGMRGLGFVGRRQTHTRFDFAVDLDFVPLKSGQEAGVTAFLTQYNHIDLSIIRQSCGKGRSIRLKTESQDVGVQPPAEVVKPVPEDWSDTIRLEIRAISATEYEFSVGPAEEGAAKITLGTVASRFVSGGKGPFTGTLVGVYATCNGQGEGEVCPEDAPAAYVSRVTYEGVEK